MRGKDNQIIKQQQELGITPAYAGKSRSAEYAMLL